jgi:hypothetical protein
MLNQEGEASWAGAGVEREAPSSSSTMIRPSHDGLGLESLGLSAREMNLGNQKKHANDTHSLFTPAMGAWTSHAKSCYI